MALALQLGSLETSEVILISLNCTTYSKRAGARSLSD